MNFFAALTCTIFAWDLAEGHKVFLRNFQSAGVSFHRTRRTHSNDRFGTNIRLVQRSPLHQPSKRHSSGGAAVSAAPTKQTTFMCSVGALLALASGKAERRQVHPLEDAPKNPFNPINPLLILRTQNPFNPINPLLILRTRTIRNPWKNIAACVILTTDLSD